MFRIPNEFCLKLGEFNSRNRGYLFEIYQVSNKMQLESWLIKCFVFLLWNTEGFFPQFLKGSFRFSAESISCNIWSKPIMIPVNFHLLKKIKDTRNYMKNTHINRVIPLLKFITVSYCV